MRKVFKRLFMGLPYVRMAHVLTALPLVRLELQQNPQALRFEHRYELYAWLAKGMLERTVCYLEFGVFKGDTIAEWARLLPGPDNRFVGFDSFDGLPEDWDHVFATTRKGTFATGGKLPDIPDSRVSFVKGCFNETLPGFARSWRLKQQRLVVHLDADLYSSTAFVLHELNAALTPGTVLIFDEFGSPLHEYRALKDWSGAYGRKYQIIGYVGSTVDQAAIELL